MEFNSFYTLPSHPPQSQFYLPSRRLQDHERVAGGDAAVATDIGDGERRGIARAAADCDFERDRGVGAGECAVGVEVAFLRRSGSCCIRLIRRVLVVSYVISCDAVERVSLSGFSDKNR